jgi:hypothetical protein
MGLTSVGKGVAEAVASTISPKAYVETAQGIYKLVTSEEYRSQVGKAVSERPETILEAIGGVIGGVIVGEAIGSVASRVIPGKTTDLGLVEPKQQSVSIEVVETERGTYLVGESYASGKAMPSKPMTQDIVTALKESPSPKELIQAETETGTLTAVKEGSKVMVKVETPEQVGYTISEAGKTLKVIANKEELMTTTGKSVAYDVKGVELVEARAGRGLRGYTLEENVKVVMKLEPDEAVKLTKDIEEAVKTHKIEAFIQEGVERGTLEVGIEPVAVRHSSETIQQLLQRIEELQKKPVQVEVKPQIPTVPSPTVVGVTLESKTGAVKTYSEARLMPYNKPDYVLMNVGYRFEPTPPLAYPQESPIHSDLGSLPIGDDFIEAIPKHYLDTINVRGREDMFRRMMDYEKRLEDINKSVSPRPTPEPPLERFMQKQFEDQGQKTYTPTPPKPIPEPPLEKVIPKPIQDETQKSWLRNPNPPVISILQEVIPKQTEKIEPKPIETPQQKDIPLNPPLPPIPKPVIKPVETPQQTPYTPPINPPIPVISIVEPVPTITTPPPIKTSPPKIQIPFTSRSFMMFSVPRTKSLKYFERVWKVGDILRINFRW